MEIIIIQVKNHLTTRKHGDNNIQDRNYLTINIVIIIIQDRNHSTTRKHGENNNTG